MSGESLKPVVVCPECGAKNPEAESTCWICGGPLTPGIEKPEPLPELDLPSPPSSSGGWRLGALMAAMALIAVFLGVAREAPGLAILVAIVATPALLVTAGTAWRRRAKGYPMAPAEKAGTFLIALAITVGVIVGLLLISAVAIVVALLVICSGRCHF